MPSVGAPLDTEPTGGTRAPASAGALPALALAGFTASFVQTILVPIQQDLPALLDAPATTTSWAITITVLVAAISTPIAGRLGDMFGKRKILIALLTILIAGSIFAAITNSAAALIIGRGLQGFGLGVIPLGIAILRDITPQERLATAIAIMSATMGIGGAIGLPISALVAESTDWRALFWVSCVLGTITVFLTYIFIPKFDHPPGGRIDFLGVIGLTLGLTGVLLLLSEGGRWPTALTWSAIAGSMFILTLWSFLELRVENPIVDLRVSARLPILVTNLASIALAFSLFTANLSYPQLLQLPTHSGGIGLPLVQASFIVAPLGLAMLVASPILAPLQRRIRPKWIVMVGALLIGAAFVINLTITNTVWVILTASTLVGFGVGFGYAALPTLIMTSIPISESAAANGLNTLMRSLGTASAAAVVATILNGTTRMEEVNTPSQFSFHTVFMAGLIAALLSAALAVLIPRPRHPLEEDEALPEQLVNPMPGNGLAED
ncbi:MFS transporter [Prescottella equi]